MDIEYFERTMQEMYEAKEVLKGIADLRAGRVVDGDSAMSRIIMAGGIQRKS